jgi:hypothetical protein
MEGRADPGMVSPGTALLRSTDSSECGVEIILTPLPPAISAETVADMTVGARRIVEQINEQHRLARSTADQAIEHAIRCGQLLIEQKKRVGHGNFGNWIAANCAFSQATANNYMLAARNPNALGKGRAIRQLYASGRIPRPKTAVPAPQPATAVATQGADTAVAAAPPADEMTFEQAVEILKRQKGARHGLFERLLKDQRDAKMALGRAEIAHRNAMTKILEAAKRIEAAAK